MHNVGKIDRIIRLIIAAGIIILYFTNIISGRLGNISLFVAALLFMTSLRKCCPIYAILGLGTCGVDTGNEEPKIKTKKLDL